MEELSTLSTCRLEKRIHMVNCCSREINSLPDELLQTIFSYIPTASLVVATGVCKRWHQVIYSGLQLHTYMVPQKPCHFMCLSPNAYEGHVFDSALDKWYQFTLPKFIGQGTIVASSCGLLCFRHICERNKICLFNPITSDQKLLPEAPFGLNSKCEFALSVNLDSREYMLAVIEFCLQPRKKGVHVRSSTLSIHTFESATQSWSTLHSEVLQYPDFVRNSLVRNGCVVCSGILYFLVNILEAGGPEVRFEVKLIMYDLSKKSSQVSLIPPLVINGNLMSHCGRLFLAGIVAKDDLNGIEGIRIWELEHGSWCELSRMPSEFIQWDAAANRRVKFCAANGLIFVEVFQSTAGLCIFDIIRQQWRWCDNCPVGDEVLKNLYERKDYSKSFCFEPRLDIRP